jgi:hypothetical protein
MKTDIENLIKAQKEVDSHGEYLLQAGWEGFRFFSNASILAATLLVVATFNPALIPLTHFSRFLISIILFIIPINLWCTFIEIDNGIRKTVDEMIVKTEEATGRNLDEKKNEVLKISPIRKIQFLTLIVLTLVIIAIIFLILN